SLDELTYNKRSYGSPEQVPLCHGGRHRNVPAATSGAPARKVRRAAAGARGLRVDHMRLARRGRRGRPGIREGAPAGGSTPLPEAVHLSAADRWNPATPDP